MKGDPNFPGGAPGLPSHHVLDIVATGRECSGFPTGFFRIRAAGTSLYWSLHYRDASDDGNGIDLWSLLQEEHAQVRLICPISWLYHLSLTSKRDEGLLHRFKRRVKPVWRPC